MINKISFSVKGMHCKSCSELIEMKLSGVRGIQNVKVSLLEEEAVVAYDTEAINEDAIYAEIRKMGYKPGSNESETAGTPQSINPAGNLNNSLSIPNSSGNINDGLDRCSDSSLNNSIISDQSGISNNQGIQGNQGNNQSQGSSVSYNQNRNQGSTPERKGILGGSLKQGLMYGVIPHIGCIGFIVASILGVTVAMEFFKPLLLNANFFYFLIALSFGFAGVSATVYLKRNGLLSMRGIARKKTYLSTMFGTTAGINLLLFLVVFPLMANFGNAPILVSAEGSPDNGGVALAGLGAVKLQVQIPCGGHAPLITNELKTISGVKGVRFDGPNYFTVSYDSSQTSVEKILSLEVFKQYAATVIQQSGGGTVSLSATNQNANQGTGQKAAGSGGSCGGGGGGCGCGGG